VCQGVIIIMTPAAGPKGGSSRQPVGTLGALTRCDGEYRDHIGILSH